MSFQFRSSLSCYTKGCNLWNDIKSCIFWKQTIVSVPRVSGIKCRPVLVPEPQLLLHHHLAPCLSVSLTCGACFCPKTWCGCLLPGCPSFITHFSSPPRVSSPHGNFLPLLQCRRVLGSVSHFASYDSARVMTSAVLTAPGFLPPAYRDLPPSYTLDSCI